MSGAFGPSGDNSQVYPGFFENPHFAPPILAARTVNAGTMGRSEGHPHPASWDFRLYARYGCPSGLPIVPTLTYFLHQKNPSDVLQHLADFWEFHYSDF